MMNKSVQMFKSSDHTTGGVSYSSKGFSPTWKVQIPLEVSWTVLITLPKLTAK
jgi:hypothetical protein